jgi:hypothetical protein
LEFQAEADDTIMDKSTNGTKDSNRHDMEDDAGNDIDENEVDLFLIIIVERIFRLLFSVKDVDTTINVGVCSFSFVVL